MGLFHSPKIVTDGLWACWDFANKKSFDGSNITSMLSAENNFKDLVQATKQTYVEQTGQLNINQWDPRGYYTVHSPAVNANIDNFDGANTGWVFSNDLRNQSPTNEATFEAVVETYQTTENQDIGIFGQGSMWRLVQDKQKWEFWVRENGNGSTTTLKTGNIITKNKWYHYVGTIKTNPGLMKIYIDGEEVASQTTPWAWGAGHTTDNMHIGQAWWGLTTSTFRGAIRLLRVYTKQLSQKQIKQNYDTVKDWMVWAHETKTTW